MAKKKHVKKKKYVNVAEQQRQQEAQYKKLFHDKLQSLCAQIGDASLYHHIPKEEKMILYMFRGAPLKVVPAEGVKIHKRLMEVLIKIIKTRQLSMKLEVIKGSGQTMTYADYLLVGMPLELHACKSDVDYPGKDRLNEYADQRYERQDEYEKGILDICAMACWTFDDIGEKYLHTYNLETDIPDLDTGLQLQTDGAILSRKEMEALISKDFRLHQKITIGTYSLETRKIHINGETHVGIQVGVIFYGNDNTPSLHHFTLSPDDMHLKTNSPFSKLGFPVYIQQHALDRMKERLGLIIPAFYISVLTEALIHKEIIPLTKTRMLIACFTNDLKVGYFLSEVVDCVVLIRTFLLLTNGGTPEGDKLSKLTGLQTEDRKYLAIDTLQGLANSDIAQNETICKLFQDAGCGSILELCTTINNDPGMMWLLEKTQPKNIISDLITEYLKPNTEEEEEEEEEND
ncbi:MAG: hypothetical protein LBL13_09990 [Bacteroidales bacterium]|jgi:hypothetical protein|nr:hypothetical protein [Bacteroidales bacterium]